MFVNRHSILTDMFDRDQWHEIFSALRKNRLRSVLTAFGVFWGIFMLVIMHGAGTGLFNGVTREFGDFATNSAFIWTQRTSIPYHGFKRGRWYHFRNDDIQALKDNIPEIELVAPKLQAGGYRGSNNVVRGLKTGAFNIHGDYPEYYLIDPVDILKGRFVNNIDIEERRKVAVIGKRVWEVLFEPGEDPLGKYIRIQGVYFKVVGLFKPRSKVNNSGDAEQTIYIPFTTLQKVYNYGDIVGYFSITAKENVPVSVVEKKAIALLKQRHDIHPDDVEAVGHANIEEEFKRMTGLFSGISWLVWIVGGFSLIAGVIGISNIMLVIVKERTKEIGIKRAIGATPFSVILQIILEAVFLTSVAGIFGLLAGVWSLEALGAVLPETDGGMFSNPGVNFSIAMTSLAILVISGVLAGLIPARRAVSVRTIDALRYE